METKVMYAVEEDQDTPIFANVDAERAALACAFIDPEAALKLASSLTTTDYYVERHGWIHEAVCVVAKNGLNVDVVTVADELERRGRLEDIGGISKLASLDTPSGLYVDHYANIVKRNAWLRRAIGAFGSVVEQAYSERNPEAVYAFAQQQLRTLQPPQTDDVVMTWEESFDVTFDMLERMEQGANERFRWPWQSWNNIVDSAEPGLVVEIAGGTAVGKTIYAECLADFWCKNGIHVGLLHFELNRDVMMQRRLCRWTGLERYVVKARKKTDEQWDKIMRASERLDTWPGRVDYGHTAGMDIDQTIQRMERMIDDHGTEVFILDHAKKLHQHASPRQMRLRLSKVQREADNVEQFKTACETLGVRGIILNHYNKMGKEAGMAATKNDIAGAGEQADLVNVIVLLHRGLADFPERDPYTNEVVVETGERSWIVDVRVDKNTMGEEKSFKQWMDPVHFLVMDRQFERVDL